MKKSLRSRILIPVSLYLLISIYLSTLPLFNILGYEFSFVLAIFSFFISGIYVIAIQNRTENKLRNGEIILHAFLLSLIPLFFVSTKGIFITNCNYFKGVGFYILLSSISSIFGASLGHFISTFIKRTSLAIGFFLLISLLILLKMPYDLIFGPKVDSYNHIFGIFAGPIYDEVVEITKPLIIYRAYTLTISALLFLAGIFVSGFNDGEKKNWKYLVPTFFLLLAIIFIFNFNAEKFGFSRSSKFIQERLGDKAETEHFIYYFSPKFKEKMPLIMDEFEFSHYKNSTFLNIAPNGKYEVYVYPDSRSQKNLMGSRGTFISKPSTGQIHMVQSSPLNTLIQHELVHLMAGDFGIPIIKISLRIAFLEGLAEAGEGSYGGQMTLDEYTAALYQLKLAPPIKSIMSPLGFWSKQSNIAYFLAGSFTKFLIDNYGIDKFKKVYKFKSLDDVYGKDLEALSSDWLKKIDKIKLSDEQLKTAEALFKPKGIFEKKCAHEVASLLDSSDQMAGCGKMEDAIRLSEKANSLSGGDPSVQSELIEDYYNLGRCDRAEPEANSLIKQSQITERTRYIAYKTLGDCSVIHENFENALSIYKLAEESVSFPSDFILNTFKISILEEKNNLVLFKEFLSEKTSSKKLDILKSLVEKSKEQDIPNAVMGKYLFQSEDFHNAAIYLSKVRRELTPNSVEIYRLQLLGASYFFNKQYKEATGVFEQLKAKHKSDALEIYADNWIAKTNFMQNRDASKKSM